MKRFTGWRVENPHGEYWTATRQRGTELRFIVSQTVVALYAKVQRVEQEEAAGPVAPSPDAVARYLDHLDRLGRVGTGR